MLLPGVIVGAAGGSGMVAGVAGADSVESGPDAMVLYAVTWHVYDLPLVSPVTVIGDPVPRREGFDPAVARYAGRGVRWRRGRSRAVEARRCEGDDELVAPDATVGCRRCVGQAGHSRGVRRISAGADVVGGRNVTCVVLPLVRPFTTSGEFPVEVSGASPEA